MPKMWNQIRELEILYDKEKAYKISYEQLDINFKIQFTNDKNSNIAEITLYNLSSKTINNLKKGLDIRLKAGYEDFNGYIFTGKIDDVSVEEDKGDVVVTLNCTPDAVSWNNEFVNKSWARGTKAKDIVKQIVQMVGWDIGMLEIGELQYNGGKVFRKLARNCLQEIAKDTNTMLYFNNGLVYMYPRNKVFKKTIVLSPLNGLIESPKKEIIGGTKKKQKSIQYKIKSSLRYDFQEDVIIKIENSKYIDPVELKIIKGTHIASDNDFYTELECKKISDLSKEIEDDKDYEVDDLT